MTQILTFVAANTAKPLDITFLEKILGEDSIPHKDDVKWLSPNKAVEIPAEQVIDSDAMQTMRQKLFDRQIDVFVTAAENRKKKLLLADMDSTIVASETLDELAEYAGIGSRIAAITKRAMEGEIDFEEALRERVGLLEGLSMDKVTETLAKTRVNDGAKRLVKTMSAHGARCVLVSGGFTVFTEPVARDVGFEYNHGNTFEIKDNRLTGRVTGEILDKNAKVAFLEHYMEELGISEDDCMTIGDGANDLPMLKMAGLGIGYKPKDIVKKEVMNVIIHGNLAASLYAQGYTDNDVSI